jgi:primosomal protein N' (replication factor Y)
LLRYPPFASLIRIVCSAPSAADAGRIAGELRTLVPAEVGTVLGPAPLFRLRGRERSQLFVKAAEREVAIDAVRAAVEQIARAASRAGVSISVDVDPE